MERRKFSLFQGGGFAFGNFRPLNFKDSNIVFQIQNSMRWKMVVNFE